MFFLILMFSATGESHLKLVFLQHPVKRQSMVSPSYLADWDEGIDTLAKETSGQVARRRLKVVWSDFDWFGLALHLSYQFDIRLRCHCRFSEAEIGSSCIAIIALSSANSVTVMFKEVCWSEAYILYRFGASTPPYGTPVLIILY